MHKLLTRQIRRHVGSIDDLPPELAPLIAAIDQAYQQADDDRALLEHSIETMSKEMIERYHRLDDALEESERAKSELATALAALEATLESTTDGLLVVDRDGRMVRMNRQFIELWRIPESIVAARDDAEALAYVVSQLREPDEFLHNVRELYANPDAESFDTLHFKDERVYERYSKPQRVDGQTVGRVWSFRDITTRLQLEEQLQQSQKMEAIGALAGGVAHDFNNLLTVIIGHLEFLQRDPRSAPHQSADLAEILTAANAAADLTRQLLAFGRRQLLQPIPLDLNEVVNALDPLLRRLIGEDIEVVIRLDASPATILADRSQLQQVVVNLAVNARDAMSRGGQLTIATANDRPAASVTGEEPTNTGAYVSLAVRDTGIGMDDEVRARIFEPFFTTKEAGHGTGLGLATVHGIVAQSGGHIGVHSEAGAGTTFHVHLPAIAAAPVALPVTPEPDTQHVPCETILVAEDEPAVSRFISRALSQRGYTVIVAGNESEALTLLASGIDHIDLILTDIVMPDISGPELVARARASRIESLPAVFMSGYTDDEILRRGLLQRGTAFIQKPFTAIELDRVIRSTIGDRTAEHRTAENLNGGTP